MDEATTLLRTTVRTFFPTSARQILAVDALIRHKVLHIEDFAALLSAQAKEIRQSLNPLRTARLITSASRPEVRVGGTSTFGGPNRTVQREYYYIDYRKTLDAIKYRIMKLRKKVQDMYQIDEAKRKDWRCPRCKSEYEELEVLDKINEEGFYCDRCGATLEQNEAALRDRGSHEKIRRLNEQLSKFDALIVRIDSKVDQLPRADNDKELFFKLFAQRIEVPKDKGGRGEWQYMEVKKGQGKEKTLEHVKVENLQVNLTSGAEHDREEAEKQEARRRDVARQNLLPVWHTQSAIGMAASGTMGVDGGTGVKSEEGVNGVGVGLKKEEDEEKKPDLGSKDMQDEVALYMAEMEREAREAELRAKEESEAEDEDDDDDDDEGDFEDVVGTSAMGTPASSQDIALPPAPTSNGVKREFDDESSEANTPASFEREVKRVRLEPAVGGSADGGANGMAATTTTTRVKAEADADADADSDEDEDFEDAM